jgi:dipicolinate synthase subunit A
MAENIKIGILGGDRRQLVMAECLAGTFECAVWGFDKIYGTTDERYLRGAVRCADWESAVKCSDAVILPLPSSADGKHLNCPLLGEGENRGAVPLRAVCEKMPMGSMLLGGILPSVVKSYAAEHGIIAYDYYNSEELQIKNSVPTAEGAIAECILRMPMTVAGMRVVVTGYGRCGRALATRLKLLGAEVFVVARSVKDLSYASVDGCVPLPLPEYREYPVNADAVFNTIPIRIFDSALLSLLPSDTVIFELATGNAGVDMERAEQLHIKVVPLPSLPGKTSPKSAGEIICAVVRDKLHSHFEGR